MNWGALAALLGGGALGGLGAGVQSADRMALARDKLRDEQDARTQQLLLDRDRMAQQQSQFDATQAAAKEARGVDLSTLPPMLRAVLDPSGAGGVLRADLVNEVYKAAMDQRAIEREQAIRGGQADVLARLGAGRPATAAMEIAPEDAMYSSDLVRPGQAAVDPNRELMAAAELLRTGPIPPLLEKILGLGEAKHITVPESASVFNTRTGQFEQPPGGQPVTEPALREGYDRSYQTDRQGRTTWSDKPTQATNIEDRLAQAQGFSSFEMAPREIKEQINATVFEQKNRVSRSQGAEGIAAGVLAKATAERGLPLAQANLHGGLVWDKTQNRVADALNTSLEDAKRAPERYVVINEKQLPQLTAIGEGKILLAQFVPLVQGLTTQPGANFAQAASMWAKTKAGVENPGVAFNAMEGTVLRMAGAMQGSRVQLSDQDRKAVVGMLPTPMDTAQSGLQRLQTVLRIFNSMEAALTGDTAALSQANQLLRQNGGAGDLGGMGALSAPSPVSSGSGWKIERMR